MVKNMALKRIVTGIVFLLTAIVPVACDLDVNLSEDGNTYEGSASWMASLADETLITQLTVPGTHDTCALNDFLNLSGTAAAQDLSLADQLDAGVRAIDIRIHKSGSSYLIHHGPAYQGMSYGDVLDVCYEFLAANPGETIFMLILAENGSTDEDILPAVVSGVEANPDRWVPTPYSVSTIRLGDVRGKIVLIKRFNGTVAVNGTEYGLASGTDFEQNGTTYRTTDPAANFENAKNALEAQRISASSRLNVIWTSCYYQGQFGIPNIRLASSVINPLLLEYLTPYSESSESNHLGIICTDHITRTIAHAIYSCN